MTTLGPGFGISPAEIEHEVSRARALTKKLADEFDSLTLEEREHLRSTALAILKDVRRRLSGEAEA